MLFQVGHLLEIVFLVYNNNAFTTTTVYVRLRSIRKDENNLDSPRSNSVKVSALNLQAFESILCNNDDKSISTL